MAPNIHQFLNFMLRPPFRITAAETTKVKPSANRTEGFYIEVVNRLITAGYCPYADFYAGRVFL